MTSNCVHFKNTIQDEIEQGRLMVEEKPMKVDNDPFNNRLDISSHFLALLIVLARVVW